MSIIPASIRKEQINHMSATVTTTKVDLTAKLDNGTTTSGAVKTISQTLGAIDKDAYDADKAYAIGAALAPCLTKSIYALEQKVTSNITNAA